MLARARSLGVARNTQFLQTKEKRTHSLRTALRCVTAYLTACTACAATTNVWARLQFCESACKYDGGGGDPDGGCLLTRASMTVHARRKKTHTYTWALQATVNHTHNPRTTLRLRLEALKVCNGVWDSPHALSHKHQDVKLSLVRKLGR